MNVERVAYGTEGFVRKAGLRFDNGLELVCTEDLAWCGKEKSDEIESKLNEIIEQLNRED